MPSASSEIKRHEVLRLSNEKSNRLTKDYIESALILLMAEKAYADITISEIVKRAGVSRTAYYRNYKSKEDILKNLLQEVIKQAHQAMGSFAYVTEPKKYWQALFTMAGAHATSINALLRCGLGPILLNEITKNLTDPIPKANMEDKYDMIFWSGAVYNVIINWLDSGMSQSADEMAELCLYIMANFNK